MINGGHTRVDSFTIVVISPLVSVPVGHGCPLHIAPLVAIWLSVVCLLNVGRSLFYYSVSVHLICGLMTGLFHSWYQDVTIGWKLQFALHRKCLQTNRAVYGIYHYNCMSVCVYRVYQMPATIMSSVACWRGSSQTISSVNSWRSITMQKSSSWSQSSLSPVSRYSSLSCKSLHRCGLANSAVSECRQKETMNHILDTCPLIKLVTGLQWLHDVEDDAHSSLKTTLTTALVV